MDGLLAHLPPSERHRRLVILLPLLLGVAALVLVACLPARAIELAEKTTGLVLLGLVTASIGPLLGLALWAALPFREFRERMARTSDEGLVVHRRLGRGRTIPWSDFEAFALRRVRGALFAFLTPRDGGATWVLEAPRDEEPLIAAMRGRPEGEVRFVYRTADGRGGCLSVWVVFTVALVAVPLLWQALSTTGVSYFGYCFAAAYPLHSLVSLVLLALVLLEKTSWAQLRIRGADCSFVVPHDRDVSCVKVSPAAIRGRTEIDDPSGLRGRRFSLPPGLLTPERQLQLIEQLLPDLAQPSSEREA